jgi:acetyl/propionyl-CoA carboxylase alpha subunit
VRVYAEDPRTFLPQAGRIEAPRSPARHGWVRIDAGVEAGDQIGLAYDPMIAKVIAHAGDRAQALDLLRAALVETEIEG